MAETSMDLVATILTGIRVLLVFALLIVARLIAGEFRALEEWRQIWLALTVGFIGMVGSLTLSILFASGVDHWVFRWLGRFVFPIQIDGGLLVGMLLLLRLLRRMHSIRGLLR